jgi:hypothetical protein
MGKTSASAIAGNNLFLDSFQRHFLDWPQTAQKVAKGFLCFLWPSFGR